MSLQNHVHYLHSSAFRLSTTFEQLMRSNTDSARKPGSRSVLRFSLMNMQATPDMVHYGNKDLFKQTYFTLSTHTRLQGHGHHDIRVQLNED